MVAYLGQFSPQFAEFRVFKVPFPPYLSSLDVYAFLLSCSQVVVIVGFISQMLGDIMITSILVWFL